MGQTVIVGQTVTVGQSVGTETLTTVIVTMEVVTQLPHDIVLTARMGVMGDEV